MGRQGESVSVREGQASILKDPAVWGARGQGLATCPRNPAPAVLGAPGQAPGHPTPCAILGRASCTAT